MPDFRVCPNLRVREVILAMVLACAAMPASAAFYVGVDAGAGLPPKLSHDEIDSLLGVPMCTYFPGAADCGVFPPTPSESLEAEYDLGWKGGLKVGTWLTRTTRVELSLGYHESDLKSAETRGASTRDVEGSLTNLSMMANIWKDFPLGRDVSAYVGGGVGATKMTLDDMSIGGTAHIDDDDTVAAAQAGLGLGYRLTDRVGLSLDYRYLMSDDAEFQLETVRDAKVENRLHLVSLGVQFYFGDSPRAVDDSDGDLVYDNQDLCPNTPPGAPVDKNGCPLDADGDYVDDQRDQCPNTPAEVEVASSGCPRDSDRDGVADARDRCPETRAGMPVDAQGCLLPVYAEPQSIYFATDSDELTAQATQTLRDIAASLKKAEGWMVVVDGHADSRGGYEYNFALSERRAEAAANYLIVEAGVAPGRLQIKPHGEGRPAADNTTRVGQLQNRRVVLRLVPVADEAVGSPVEDSEPAKDGETSSEEPTEHDA